MQSPKQAKASQPGNFHLLRHLSVISLVAMLLTSAVLILLYRQDQIAGHKEFAAQQNEKAAIHLMRLLGEQINALVSTSQVLDPQALRENPNIDIFNAALETAQEDSIFKLKIYNLSGATIYSTVRAEIGTANQHPDRLEKALHGEVLHKLAFQQTARGTAGELHDRYIANTYMPLSFSGKQIGAIEIFADATPTYKAIYANTIRIALIVFGAFAMLYAALFFTVRKTDRAVSEWQKVNARSEELFRAVFDNAAVGIAQISPAGHFLQINNEFCQIIGYSRDEVLSQGFTFQQITFPGDLDIDQANVDKLLGGSGNRYVREKRYIRRDGSIVWVSLSLYLVKNDAGESLYFISAVKDITENKRADEELRIAATAFESQDGMAITDAQNVILRVNHAFTEITGYTAEEAVGQTPRLLKSGRHDAEFYAAMWEQIRLSGAWKGEIWNRRKNGEIYPEQLTITAVKGDGGKITHYVATMHDITKRKVAEEQIRNLAFYDTLTRLPNRRVLNDRLGQVMAASKRSGCYAALMFLDLDNFKPLNDTYGHGVGDLLLLEVAQRLVGCVREVDTVARFGGDEFVVILSELSEDRDASTANARNVAEKIRTALSDPYLLTFRHEGAAETAIEHHCAASIGVVLFYKHETGVEDILKRADMAMYKAKEDGRNLVRFYEPKKSG